MARPTSISTEHIVDVARRLFLEGGYGVSTSAIAGAAGISEGTIFKRFPTKEALFMAAMGLPKPTFLSELPSRVGSGDIRARLVELAFEMHAFYAQLMPRMMMMMSKGASSPMAHFDGMEVPPPVRILLAVRAYFEAEHAAGRMCCDRPELAARLFTGGIVHFVVLRLYLPKPGEHLITEEEAYLGQMVDTLLEGLGS
jgi:AcrR family transcriptional regulator